MNEHTLYVGLDVHAETIAVAVAQTHGHQEVRSLGTIANRPEAMRKLVRKLRREGAVPKVCYEAGPCGYVLYWQLVELDIECIVVAPSLVPRKPGERVKTDKRDALKLAQAFRAGDLTAVWVPEPQHEALRDLVRNRLAAKQDQTRCRHRISKFLLRRGLRRPSKTRAWGSVHLKWLHERRFELYAHQATMVDLLAELQHVGERLERLERAIDHAIEQLPEADQQLIQGLQALRGVARTTAVTLISELGRVSRFDNPRQLMAYIGLVPSEHSSGSKRRLGAITKTGNSHVRRVLVEASWAYRHRPSVRGDLLKRQKLCSDAVCTIANKAQHRLNLRYRRLTARKPTPVAVTAIARELLGFVWAVGCQLEREVDTDAAPLAAAQRYVVDRSRKAA